MTREKMIIILIFHFVILFKFHHFLIFTLLKIKFNAVWIKKKRIGNTRRIDLKFVWWLVFCIFLFQPMIMIIKFDSMLIQNHFFVPCVYTIVHKVFCFAHLNHLFDSHPSTSWIWRDKKKQVRGSTSLIAKEWET